MDTDVHSGAPVTDRWSTIIANAKDALALNPTFEPTDDELDALDDCVYLLEHLGYCE